MLLNRRIHLAQQPARGPPWPRRGRALAACGVQPRHRGDQAGDDAVQRLANRDRPVVTTGPGGGSCCAAPAGRRPAGFAGRLADLPADDLDLDQVVGLAVQDVAQRRQRVRRQALRNLGHQPEDLLPRQVNAALGQQRHQIRGLEQALLGHPQPQMPPDTHLLRHGCSPQRAA